MPIRKGLLTVLITVGIFWNTGLLKADTYTSPESAGEVYKLQGEYSGVLEAWGGAWGAQVVALANSKFSIVLYPGGLPGDGYRSGTDRKNLVAKSEGKLAVANADSFRVEITGNELSIVDSENKSLGKLAKVNRQSVTLGALAPEGSIVLFDGGSAEKFRGGRLIEGRLLAVGCESLETFGDHHLHIEFSVPFMPKDRGQGRGNSGVYVQGRYEIQILDSFGLDSKDNDCGGIYQIAKPSVNMCFPPLAWQTYDIDFRAATYDERGNKTSNALMSVKHNGKLIHDSLELPNHTPGKHAEADSPGPLFLQDHNNPVFFQNIWVVKK